MAAPFASKLFENANTSADGWDDWDWVENNNSNAAKQQQQQQHQQSYLQTIQSVPIPSVPNNVQQVPTEHQPLNFFNPVNNSIPSQTHPAIDQYTQSSARSNNLTGPLPSTTAASNNNHLKSFNHFQSENQHHQQFTGIESTFVVNNNQSADSINSNNNVQSSTVTNYQSLQNQFSQPGHNQWPAVPFSKENNQMTNALPQQFMQVESQESLPPPPIPARAQYYDQMTAEQNVSVDNEFSQFTNPQLENQQTDVSTQQVTPFGNPNANANLQPVLPPPSLNQSPFANTNPFKRVGSHTHRTTPPMSAAPIVSNASPSASTTPLENQPQRISHHEYADSIQHNDRNEYLQTGHLSGDGENNNLNITLDNNPDTPMQQNSSDGNGLDSELPPPGLSRLVLGEPEPFPPNEENSQPPPGLSRLVPGTEITHSSNINFRQADGQDTIQPNRSNNQFLNAQSQQVLNLPPPPPLTSHEIENYEAISESDRNQYLVPGENPIDNANILVSGTSSNAGNIEQRVVTGLENVENQAMSTLPERQRELEMDGENLEDQQQQQQQQQFQSRHGNVPIGNTTTLSQSESIEELDAPGNKNQSNPSTGNDDSDREKSYYNRNKGSSNRNRNDDRLRKRDERHENRYETEDTDHSTRDKKRNKDRYEEKERGYRGRSADIDENDNRSHRGEKSYRDRYERYRQTDNRSHRDEKHNRYETDGSRYENDDYRQERRRRNEKENEDWYRDRYDRVDRGGERYYRSKDYERERGK